MPKTDFSFSLDYAFKKTQEAENEIREYLKTGDSAHLIYCIYELGSAIRELVEVIQNLAPKIEECSDRLEELEDEVSRLTG